MVQNLKENGCDVDYWEIEGGDHCLENMPDRTERIFEWLQK